MTKMKNLLFFLCLLLWGVECKHLTIVIDSAIPALDDKYIVETREALKYAFERYILPHDKLTVYTFSENSVEKIIDNISCGKKAFIHAQIDAIKFSIGCADWSSALGSIDANSASKDVVFIVDENPCKGDPTEVFKKLQQRHINVFTIGIGYGVDRVWLKKISTNKAFKWIQEFHYSHQKKASRTLRHRGNVLRETIQETTPTDIAIATLLGVFIALLIIISFIFSCRHSRNFQVKQNKRYASG